MKNSNEIIDILGAIELPEEIKKEENNFIKNTLVTTEFYFKTNNKEEKILDDVLNNLNTFDLNKKIKKESKILKQFISASIFGLKYITTSIFIFGVLLISTNFSAYSNILQSYLFEDEHKQNAVSLLNSVDAGEIKEKNTKIVIHKKSKKEKQEELKAISLETEKITNNFSIKQIISKSDNDNIDLGIDIVPYENRLVIPKIGKNIPIIDVKEKTVESKNKLDNILMKELEFGVVRYPGSAKPGEKGNSFIFGHSSNFPWIAGNYNEVFARLGQMKTGDIVFSYYGQKKYKYKITSKKVVSPNEVGVLKNDKTKKQLTLMTCWPVGTTLNRLILTADLVE